MRFRIAADGGGAEQIGGAREILRKLLALQIEQAEIVFGGGVPELGGRGEQAGGFVRIARAGAAFQIEHRQREHGVAVAMRGGELVPLRRLGVVAADAEPLRVEFAEQRHGGRIVLLRAFGGFRQRGEEIAALIGAKCEIDIAIVGRGRGIGFARAATFLQARSWPVKFWTAPRPARRMR